MTVKEPEQVRVVAPSTLNAGYTFDVTTADGRTLTVKVPTGGVTEGQSFDAEVVVDVDDDIKSSATNPNFVAVMAVPATASVLDTEPEIPVAVASSITAVGEAAPTITKTVIKNPDGTETVTEETRYPDGRITTTTTTLAAAAAATTTGGGGGTPPTTFAVPKGAWRHDLFSCCDTCSSGMFWMAWCCSYAALGQILQRMKLNFCGSESSGLGYKNSCMLWTVLMLVMWVITLILMPFSENASIIISYAMLILAVFAMTKARYYMRQKYSIPADCCSDSGCLSDCCCMWWCSCCGLIQMMRHTHDEHKYVYHCTSPTGLHADVPEIV